MCTHRHAQTHTHTHKVLCLKCIQFQKEQMSSLSVCVIRLETHLRSFNTPHLHQLIAYFYFHIHHICPHLNIVIEKPQYSFVSTNLEIAVFFFFRTLLFFSSFCSQAHFDVPAVCVVTACQQIDASLGESRHYSV